MRDDSTKTKAALREILEGCRRKKVLLSKAMHTKAIPEIAEPYTLPPPTLTLPFPSDVMRSIDMLPLSKESLVTIKAKFNQRISIAQKHVLDSYRQCCSDLSNTSSTTTKLEKLRDYYLNFYEEKSLECVRNAVNDLRHKIQQARAAAKKPLFNSEFTPLLEEYFSCNPYPSSSDRLTLASESNMTSRQIEVWFQNHRNRSKREGIKLARPNGAIPAADFLGSYHRRSTPERSVTPVETSATAVTEQTCQYLPSNYASFHYPRPPYAFPTPYPPNVDQEPFPTGVHHLKISSELWPRATLPKSFPSPATIDVDVLAERLSASLNLRERGKSQVIRRSPSVCEPEPWYAGRVVRLVKGTHPAVIQPVPLSRAKQSSCVVGGMWQQADQSSKKPPAFPKRVPPQPQPSPFGLLSRTPSTRSFSSSSLSTADSPSDSSSRCSSSSLTEPITPPSSPASPLSSPLDIRSHLKPLGGSLGAKSGQYGDAITGDFFMHLPSRSQTLSIFSNISANLLTNPIFFDTRIC